MPSTREKPKGKSTASPGKDNTKKVEKEIKPDPPLEKPKSTASPGKKKRPVVKKAKTKRPPHPPKKVTRAKVYRFTAVDGVVHTLTLQQKEFAEYFCQFSMDGIQAIIQAGYNVSGKKGKINYKLAAVMARENLLNTRISAYIEILLERYGLTDDNVDKQLLILINQNVDLSTKARGIDIYYKKKGLYAPQKIDPGENIAGVLERLAGLLPQ